MKSLFFKNALFLLFLFSGLGCMGQDQPTTNNWQDDLRFLQETVHNDYPFLFKKVTAAEFDTAVEAFYKEIPDLEQHEIIVGFNKIIALFKYGHTRMSYYNSPFQFHRLPMQLQLFPEGVFITGIHNDHAPWAGAKLVAVEGVETEKVLEAIYPVVPVENESYFKAYGINYLNFTEVLHAQSITDTLQESITLTLEKDGKTQKVTIKAQPYGDLPLRYGEVIPGTDWVSARDQSQDPHYLKNLDRIYYYEYLPEQKTVYVRQSQIQDDSTENIPTFYEKVFDFVENNAVDRLVIDVRLNGGGNNYKNKPVVTGIIKTEKINQEGKLFVIIGRRTFSACQNLVNELDNYTNAIFVGEPTAENINFYGDNKKVVLPNSKLPVYLSFAWWQDKPQWEGGPHLAPDVPVEPSIEDYLANRDPVLEAALNFQGSDFIRDPIQYLTDLFMAGKMEELQSESVRLVNDPQYSNVPFEQAFNRAGYSLLDSGQQKEALWVFEMTTQLFPDSVYAWYSLADAHMAAKNMGEAKVYFEKVIARDPKGANAKNAREKLKEMAEKE